MGDRKEQTTGMSDEAFKGLLARKDEYKVLGKKLSMLKQAMQAELDLTAKSEQQKIDNKNKHEKLLGQIEWKTNQNERLNTEIKQLKQEILDQRNIKRKLREQQLNLPKLSPLSSERTPPTSSAR